LSAGASRKASLSGFDSCATVILLGYQFFVRATFHRVSTFFLSVGEKLGAKWAQNPAFLSTIRGRLVSKGSRINGNFADFW